MFQVDRTLRTWATPCVESLDRKVSVEAEALAEHRLRYLAYEGEVSGGRGSVQRVLSGTFELREDQVGRFGAQLRWNDAAGIEHRAAVTIYRSCEESSALEPDPPWRLRFVPYG